MKSQSVCHCVNVRRASRALTKFYDELLKPSGLNVTQYSLLSHLKRLSPITMNELALEIRLERTTLLRNLKPLLKQSYVEFESIAHTKAQHIHLSEKGLAVQNEAYAYWQKAQQILEEKVGKNELSTFFNVLHTIETLQPSEEL